jgi:hypothetical protein
MHGLIHPLWVIAATSAINNEPQIMQMYLLRYSS